MSEEQIELAIELINKGKSYTEISKLINVNRKRISKELKKLGVESKSKHYRNKNHKYSKNDNEILELYNEWQESGLSLSKFAKTKPHTRDTMSAWFKSIGKEVIKDNNRKPINENYFDVPNEDNMYWAGFLLADGYISKNGINLELSLKDKEHVEKFKNSLESDCKISKRIVKSNNATVYRISIGCKHICDQLKKYGVVNNKTDIVIDIPDTIPKEYLKDYIRGFFEGDGGYKFTNGKMNGVSFTTHYGESLRNIAKLLEDNVGIKNINILEYDNRAPYMTIYKDREKFLNWIYKDANIYLDRKYKIYKEYFAV